MWILKNRQFWMALFFTAAILALAKVTRGQAEDQAASFAILQAKIQIQPVDPKGLVQDKIQPGSAVKVSLKITNKSSVPSVPGQVYIQYAFIEPLQAHARSVIFQTEKELFPSLKPGEETTIHFQTPQQLPSLTDFIRDDWALREYQAILVLGDQSVVIGKQALTFSAYYYPGFAHEIPIEVPAQLKPSFN